MPAIPTYTCRFHASLRGPQHHHLRRTWTCRVKWWSYADDRLDGRGAAELCEADVDVVAYDAEEARKLVRREWGQHGTVGPAKRAA